MKKTYMKPAILVVKIEQQLPLAYSTTGYNGKTIGTYRGSGTPNSNDDTLGDGDEIW